ncbi:MAG: peptide-methionine (R)-S-oxide reductase MsrB [Nitrosospira sp.]|nr:peptide-methionine (R)-S-oxide reductase MsrB [Nitrosospira sp.]
MNRRSVLQALSALAAMPLIPACSRDITAADEAGVVTVQRLKKPRKEWRELVSPEAYKVLFEEDTEPPSTSPLNYEDRDGTFVCAACHLPLFDSAYKYESRTGWPSFTQPIAGHVGTKRDYKMVFPRTEYHCARCGGHQGHVFSDGPRPRGERWCNNGLALLFVPREEPLPALRS